MRLLSATANDHKLCEIRAILGPEIEVGARPVDFPPVVEDAETFEGNARLKVAAIVQASGSAAVADDSGLEVDALGGAPGVRSARFGGEGAGDRVNVERLLAELDAVRATGRASRRARFRSVAVVGWPDGRVLVAEGVVEGVIAPAPRGESGFGYDPVFIPADGDGRTFAEMTAAEKNQISHRGRAFRRLRGDLLRRGSR